MIALINDWVVAVHEADIQLLGMFSYVSVNERATANHSIRKPRVLVGTILKEPNELLPSRYAAGNRRNPVTSPARA